MKTMKMKKGLILAVMAVIAAGCVHAGEFGQHYYSLTDGIKAGSLREAGFTFITRTTTRYANKWYDQNGNGRYFKREIFFVEPELSWSSEAPVLLGARYEARVALPLAYHVEDMSMRDRTDKRSHITMKTGDLRVTPISLGWEFCKWDLTAGYTMFAPVGSFSLDIVDDNTPGAAKPDYPNAGKGYWTHMASLGATYYFDDAKTWSASLMSNYEFHSRQDDTNVKFGQNFHFTYGIGKEFCSGWRLGVVGYGSIQTTDNKVRNDTPNSYRYLNGGSGNRVFGTGLEIGYQRKNSRIPWFITARAAIEYGAKGALRGYRSVFDLGLRF